MNCDQSLSGRIRGSLEVVAEGWDLSRERLADLREPLAEVLPPMLGDEHVRHTTPVAAGIIGRGS